MQRYGKDPLHFTHATTAAAKIRSTHELMDTPVSIGFSEHSSSTGYSRPYLDRCRTVVLNYLARIEAGKGRQAWARVTKAWVSRSSQDGSWFQGGTACNPAS